MSYSSYLLGLNEQTKTSEDDMFLFNEADFPSVDNSGFNDEDPMGALKIKKPESEGLAAAIAAEDQFAVASDGRDTDVEPSFHEAFPEDKSGFEKDAKLNESVEVITEGLFKKKEKKEPPKKYAPFVKEEKTKMRSIVRSNIDKYPKLKKAISFDVDDQNTSDDQFTICFVDLWDYPGFDRSHADIYMDEYEEFTTSVKNEIDKVVKCKIDFYDGDWDDFYITADSRKPLESTNESVDVEVVAPETIPSAPAEADQYSDPTTEDITGDASPVELATDDIADDISFGESMTGWDDLF